MKSKKNTKYLKDKDQSSAGFTLIELLVAIVVTMALTTIVLLNYRSADRSRRVQLASDTVISALTTAQNASLTGKQGVGCANGNSGIVNPYFLVFDQSATSITVACTPSSAIQTFTLPAQTRIKPTGISVNGTPVSHLYIYFFPPFGSIKYCNPASMTCNPPATPNASSFATARITLESINAAPGSAERVINLDGLSGKIDVGMLVPSRSLGLLSELPLSISAALEFIKNLVY